MSTDKGELKPRDKVVTKMTREGAVKENLTENSTERISKRLEETKLVQPSEAKETAPAVSEEELKALIRHELHTMLKFPEETEPDMIRVFRHEHAIPQYEQNSGTRFETIDELQAHYPGLTLAGNIKGGIGMADRIRQATEIANKLING